MGLKCKIKDWVKVAGAIRNIEKLSEDKQVRGIRNLLKSGDLHPQVVAQKIAVKSQASMVKEVKKRLKDGEEVSVEVLIGTIKDNPDFLSLCEEVGLSMAFFEGMAENAISDVKAGKEGQKAKKIGRNDNCPCGSGKKFKKCCGG